jgi:hypothetical protein
MRTTARGAQALASGRPYGRLLTARLRRVGERSMGYARRDWRAGGYVTFGTALGLTTLLVIVAYYLNKPQPELDPDSSAYLSVATHYALHGWFIDPARLPGYPLFIRFVFAVAGSGNLVALGVAQAGLFLIATLELYALLCLLVRSARVAFVAGLLIGTNTHILSYVKPVLSEGLTLFCAVNVAVAIVLYLRRPGALRLWAVALCVLTLYMTRPEWMYLPVPLLAFMLWVAHRRGQLRRLVPHVAAALVLLYATLGLYVHANAAQNHCACVTYVANINILGKVMQYHMQNEAPARYADITRLVNHYMARGDLDPWDVIRSPYPPVRAQYFARAAAYGSAIMRDHPTEFVARSVPLALDSLTMTSPFSPINEQGPFAVPLHLLGTFSTLVLRLLVFFPLLAAGWWLLFARRRIAQIERAEIMAALALLVCYDLVLTTVGGYVYYERLHTPFDPLLIIVVWGSAALGGMWLAERLGQHYRPPHPWRRHARAASRVTASA